MANKKQYTEYLDEKLLADELINARLFDNKSFQWILDRELQKKIKAEKREWPLA